MSRTVIIGTKWQIRHIRENIDTLIDEECREGDIEFCVDIDDLEEVLTGTKTPEERRKATLPRCVYYTGQIRQYERYEHGVIGDTLNDPQRIREMIEARGIAPKKLEVPLPYNNAPPPSYRN